MKRREYKTKWQRENYRERGRLASKRYLEKLRKTVLGIYGSICACCGFSDQDKRIGHMPFLQIDKVNGGDTRVRTVTFKNNIVKFLRYLRDERPEGYRILCAGCNHAMEPGKEKCILHE